MSWKRSFFLRIECCNSYTHRVDQKSTDTHMILSIIFIKIAEVDTFLIHVHMYTYK